MTITVTYNVYKEVLDDKIAMDAMRRVADETVGDAEFIELKTAFTGDDFEKNKITVQFTYKAK